VLRSTLARCAALGAALAVTAAGGASAHGGAKADARPVLGPLPAALAGMRVELRETLGAQLLLENPTPRRVEVLDEHGAPFLRIGPGGVEANLAAAAWYRTLGPASAVPPGVSPGAAPRWVRARKEPSYGWFDPRLVAGAQAHASDGEGEFGRWEVPLRVDGAPAVLAGRFRAERPAAGRYVARLTSPAEIAPGVRVTLLPGRAPGLLVHNASEKRLLVFGADGEPFLRIAPHGVDANLRSRTWQQSARSASVPEAPPARADARDSSPVWKSVATLPRFGWIEPRALVMGASPAASPGAGAEVLEWRVPMQLGEEPLLVSGVVSWRPSTVAGGVAASGESQNSRTASQASPAAGSAITAPRSR
jgi:hypothetical protein